jgi:hypothetical protein
MKTKKNILFLIENGLSSKTVSSLSDKQFGLLVEKFKKYKKEESKEEWQKNVSQEVTYTAPVSDAAKGLAVPPPTDPKKRTMVSIEGGNLKVTQAESEMTEDADVDTLLNPDEFGGNEPVNYKNPEDYGTDNSVDPDGSLDGMPQTEGEIKEKFESKAQQGLFWARCNKCSSKNCKWCKMAKEFSDSTSKKQYEDMPEKKHPEKTVKYKKKETKENLQKFLEEKISQIVDENIDAKMSKKDLIETLKKKSKSMIIRRPKKMTMFSDEAPMELPIGKLYSIGKKSK